MPSEKVLDWNTPIGPLDKPVPVPVPAVLSDAPPACPYNPNHDDMEKALLSAALCQPKVVVPYCNTIGLPGGAFQDPTRRKIYATILRQFAAKKYIDPMLIRMLPVCHKLFLMIYWPLSHSRFTAPIMPISFTDNTSSVKLGELSLAVQDESKNMMMYLDSIRYYPKTLRRNQAPGYRHSCPVAD